jgi:hypothetical protein
MRASLPIALLLATLAGCSAGVPDAPSATLRAYARALEDKRVEDAYALLSDEAKRGIPLDSFRRMVLENPADVLEVAAALARPSGKPVIRSTVTLPGGEELVLVLEGNTWRVDAAAIDLYSQRTPRQALVGFLRAIERKRYDVVLRFVPDQEREGLPIAPLQPKSEGPAGPPTPGSGPPTDPATPAPTPSPDSAPGGLDTEGALTAERLKEEFEGPQKDEALRVLEAIRAALPSATIEETGDEAAMSYGSGGTVSFIRERGVWKIRDF